MSLTPIGEPRHKVTVSTLREKKLHRDPITCLTAYDYPTARLVDEAGLDIILVGDSLAMTLLGYENTLSVTMDEMLHHVRAARRGVKDALLIADMPYGSYHVSTEQAVKNAARFVKEGGAEAVKIEGGEKRVDVIRRVIDAEIPVAGHIGLTPQSLNIMGGYKVQGKTLNAVEQLTRDAVALDRAGVAVSLSGRHSARSGGDDYGRSRNTHDRNRGRSRLRWPGACVSRSHELDLRAAGEICAPLWRRRGFDHAVGSQLQGRCRVTPVPERGRIVSSAQGHAGGTRNRAAPQARHAARMTARDNRIVDSDPAKILSKIAEARAACRELRAGSKRLGLVPTMGALHAGHISLVRAAKARCDAVVVSIFVNPTQFGPTEDFAKYPRPFERDRAALDKEGADAIFAPAVEEMYPKGETTWVTVEGLSEKLDGLSRPGHFRGVASVVSKLFHAIEPDVAFFGQKDAAQLAVIRRMVRDLNFPVEIIGCPIVREPDGLAMSSRNAYLSPDERRRALALSHSLQKVERTFRDGERDMSVLVKVGRDVIAQEPEIRVDYFEIVDPDTLDPVEHVTGKVLVAVAAYVGSTRLIDNTLLHY